MKSNVKNDESNGIRLLDRIIWSRDFKSDVKIWIKKKKKRPLRPDKRQWKLSCGRTRRGARTYPVWKRRTRPTPRRLCPGISSWSALSFRGVRTVSGPLSLRPGVVGRGKTCGRCVTERYFFTARAHGANDSRKPPTERVRGRRRGTRHGYRRIENGVPERNSRRQHLRATGARRKRKSRFDDGNKQLKNDRYAARLYSACELVVVVAGRTPDGYWTESETHVAV